MSKKYPPPEYKKGDLITGVDRSFTRSIYRYHGMVKNQTKIVMECIVYDGVWGNGKVQDFPARMAQEYRKATREELVESGVIPKSIDFITQ